MTSWSLMMSAKTVYLAVMSMTKFFNQEWGTFGAYIVLMYDKNSSCETKGGDRYNCYTITVHNICSQWDGMSIIYNILYGCEEGPRTTSSLVITHTQLGQTCQQAAWAASVVWATGKPHPPNKLCTCESAPLCSTLRVCFTANILSLHSTVLCHLIDRKYPAT